MISKHYSWYAPPPNVAILEMVTFSKGVRQTSKYSQDKTTHYIQVQSSLTLDLDIWTYPLIIKVKVFKIDVCQAKASLVIERIVKSSMTFDGVTLKLIGINYFLGDIYFYVFLAKCS